jgi:proliferating cell nuclear antigen
MDSVTEKMNNMSLGFKVVVENPDVLKKMFMLLDELNDDVNLMFTEHGMKIQSMDTSHVALTTVKISKEFFTTYSVPQFVTIGIKLSTLVRVLGCIEGQFYFEYSEDFPDEFVICSEHEHFRLRTIDMDSEEMDVPDMEYDVEIDADAGVLSKYFKNLASFGDTMAFSTDNETLNMSTSGDIGKVSMTIHDQRVKINGQLTAKFASRYLVTFAKAASISKTAIIRLANEQPILLKYEFGKDSYISFFLAPKIVDNDTEDEE